MSELWPWLALVLLGAFHGLNPAMGWLFAVARGLQEKQRLAVLEALLPIALGHAVSVALVVVVISSAEQLAVPQTLRLVGGTALILFGLYKLLRSRSHPRWVGMRVGLWELAIWSFLMSTAHGAGLMLVPVMLALPHAGGHGDHLAGPNGAALPVDPGAAEVLVHTTAMLIAMGLVALVVYEKLGLAVLRVAWVNLDIIWAFAIVIAGIFTLFI